MIVQSRSKRKASGGLYKKFKKKKLYEKGNDPTHPKLGPTKRRVDRVKYGNYKIRVIRCDEVYVNVDNNKVVKTKILNVVDNPADKQLARQNILTKGSIVKTELGLVRITSRPGQTGQVQGVLIKS
ncbi:MAG: 30S ribosomal protein S8e [Candidatus Woesearchaeota archaeon]